MGVKSLWNLLTPVGRPVMLETMEGKSMAIDSSIWIYQFQATMRDKEGRALVNAHVLGFLRRICKLLFYGIKPVFVFDGGAPALKRMTITERKRKKSGAADSHARIAERLLAAQLRREALNHANSSKSSGKGKSPAVVDDNTVYYEDIDGSRPNTTPIQNKNKPKEPTSSTKKNRWEEKRDPYRLPEVDMDAMIEKATRNSSAPDPRLASEEELRAFLEMLRPEDLDVSSPAFKELPTEVQYEIIGDLRLKSRQTSHLRLQAMLRDSRTPLDFSRAQIVNLKQRNALTQQLLETTDSIGKANVTIPVRIASERNKEYLLVKNEGEEGGWVLGIRDEGTQDKPIVIETDESTISEADSESDDMDMEEVAIPAPSASTFDPDLRYYQRENALDAIARRQLADSMHGKPKFKKEKSLFIPDITGLNSEAGSDLEEDDFGFSAAIEESLIGAYREDDSELTAAVQASLEEKEADDLRKAIEESRSNLSTNSITNRIKQDDSSSRVAGPSNLGPSHHKGLSGYDDDLYADYTPSRLDTALRFANTSQDTRSRVSPTSEFSNPILLMETPTSSTGGVNATSFVSDADDEEDDDMEEVVPFQSAIKFNIKESSQTPIKWEANTDTITTPKAQSRPLKDEYEQVQHKPESYEDYKGYSFQTHRLVSESPKLKTETPKPEVPISQPQPKDSESSSSESGDETWPHSPPFGKPIILEDSTPSTPATPSNPTKTQPTEPESWDAAQEMNAHEEEGEFARFAAQVRGRDVNEVRKEIDEEIRQLNQQRKAAMRDSDEITQTMIAQIMTMLRLFGIPYITAPMEAEAQCATLVSLNLVDGIITDDSDVFLFGGKRVFKNMFNQSKTVECFLLLDLSRELGLDRDTLVRLAYLLGSDYVEGLSGVGPVVAMELLREFPGEDGLVRFREWWMKVQSGKDKETDNVSSFRKRFKKRFKDLYLPPEWPNPAVKDAYFNPTVDTSSEPFKWGLPDLDGLRDFFQNELSWNANKVDELLLPIIQRMNRRNQEAALNHQGTLNTFFSIPSAITGTGTGTGSIEPRRRTAYTSKRLQAVVDAHKAQRGQKGQKDNGGPNTNTNTDTDTNMGTNTGSGTGIPTQEGENKDVNGNKDEEPDPTLNKTRGRRGTRGSRTRGQGQGQGRGRGRGRGRGGKTSTQTPPPHEDNTPTTSTSTSISTDPKPKPKPKPKATRKRKKRPSTTSESEVGEGEEYKALNSGAGPSREMSLRRRVHMTRETPLSSTKTKLDEEGGGEAIVTDSEGSEYGGS